MKKITIIALLLLVSLLVLAQGFQSATCPYCGATAPATGSTRRNPNAPPALECQYSHKNYEQGREVTHTFWQPCGS